jgi:hypothetical protein
MPPRAPFIGALILAALLLDHTLPTLPGASFHDLAFHHVMVNISP